MSMKSMVRVLVASVMLCFGLSYGVAHAAGKKGGAHGSCASFKDQNSCKGACAWTAGKCATKGHAAGKSHPGKSTATNKKPGKAAAPAAATEPAAEPAAEPAEGAEATEEVTTDEDL